MLSTDGILNGSIEKPSVYRVILSSGPKQSKGSLEEQNEVSRRMKCAIQKFIANIENRIA